MTLRKVQWCFNFLARRKTLKRGGRGVNRLKRREGIETIGENKNLKI